MRTQNDFSETLIAIGGKIRATGILLSFGAAKAIVGGRTHRTMKQIGDYFMSNPSSGYRVFCPLCDVGIACTEKHLGKRIRCPKCEKEFRVPQVSVQHVAPSRPGAPPIEAPPIEREPLRVEPVRQHSQSGHRPNAAATFRSNGDLLRSVWPPTTRMSVVAWTVTGVYVTWLGLMLLGGIGGFLSEDDRPGVLQTVVTIIFGPVFMTALFVMYAAPSGIAFLRNHANVIPIAIVNFAFGWTALGWVVSLAWSFTSSNENSR